MIPKAYLAPLWAFSSGVFTVWGVEFLHQGDTASGVAEMVCAALMCLFCFAAIKL